LHRFCALQAPGPKPISKIPFPLFCDYSENGSLAGVLRTCYIIKEEFGMRRFEFSNPSKREKSLEFLLELHRRLKESGLIPTHKLFFSEYVDAIDTEKVRVVFFFSRIRFKPAKSPCSFVLLVFCGTFDHLLILFFYS
jgi:hypothetical protein